MASVSSSGSTSSYNSSNPSATSSSAIDVAGIVDQLMTVSKIPLTKLQNKMTQSSVIISDLTVLKSKIATFQTALTSLESPNSFNTVNSTSVSTGATTTSSVTASNGATIGRYNLNVTQVAESSNFSINGFTSKTELVTLNGVSIGSGLDITIGTGSSAVTYNSATDYDSTTTPATTGGTLSKINSSTSTLTDINNWINRLYSNFGVNVSSNIIETTTGNYALSINGTKTGITNAVAFNGLNGKSVTTAISGSSITNSTSSSAGVTVNSSAKDALVSVNGLDVQRSSNTISDVITNAVINLGSTGSSLATIFSGTDNSSSVINSFVTAYNDVITQYKAMTANSINNPSLPRGSLSDAPSLLSFVSQIKQVLSSGALSASKSVISLSSLGVDFQSDGTMKFNKDNFSTAQSQGLLGTLSAGINVGGTVNSTANLYTTLSNLVNPGGTIDSTITLQKNDILYTNSRAKVLETQIELQRSSYTATYSKLNALLFQLSQASSQLTSSLTAVTNINSGK